MSRLKEGREQSLNGEENGIGTVGFLCYAMLRYAMLYYAMRYYTVLHYALEEERQLGMALGAESAVNAVM
jgi:hypothetical protein